MAANRAHVETGTPGPLRPVPIPRRRCTRGSADHRRTHLGPRPQVVPCRRLPAASAPGRGNGYGHEDLVPPRRRQLLTSSLRDDAVTEVSSVVTFATSTFWGARSHFHRS